MMMHKRGMRLPEFGIGSESSRVIYFRGFLNNNFLNNNRLDSSVGRASAFGAGGRGFESRGRTIPKVYKMVLAAPLLTLA